MRTADEAAGLHGEEAGSILVLKPGPWSSRRWGLSDVLHVDSSEHG